MTEPAIRRKVSRSSLPDAPGADKRFAKPEGAWIVGGALALIFAGHLLFGALVTQTALAVVVGAALLLCVCLITPSLRTDLTRVKGLRIPAALFAMVILVALWSLTPFVPGGPHPIWSYVGISPGAATIDKSATVLEITKLLGLGCLFLVGAATGKSDGRARTAINGLLLAGSLFGLWAFLTWVMGYDARDRVRLEGNFLTPNTAGTLFAMLLVIALGALISGLRSSSKRNHVSATTPYAAAILIALTCLVSTASRGAVLGAALGGAAMLLLSVYSGNISWTRRTWSIIAGLALGFVVVVFASDVLFSRLLDSGKDLAARGFIFSEHWEAFAAAPWMGTGLGTFDALNKSLMTSESFQGLWAIRAVHNVYLNWLELAGLLGAIPMFLCIGSILWITARGGLRRTRMTSLIFALIGADVVVLVHGATDFALETYSFAAMWAYLLGLQLSLSEGSRA